MGKFVAGMTIGGGIGAALGFYGCFMLLMKSDNIRDGFKNAIADSVERLFFGATRKECEERRYWRKAADKYKYAQHWRYENYDNT